MIFEISSTSRKKENQIRLNYETKESAWNEFIENCKTKDERENFYKNLMESRTEKSLKESLKDLDWVLNQIEGNDELINYLLDSNPVLNDDPKVSEELIKRFGTYEEIINSFKNLKKNLELNILEEVYNG